MQVNEHNTAFRVWGMFDGERFDRNFPSVTAWRAWRRCNEVRYEIEVYGMKSVN